MLRSDLAAVTVVDGSDRVLGVLTAAGIHRALRAAT